MCVKYLLRKQHLYTSLVLLLPSSKEETIPKALLMYRGFVKRPYVQFVPNFKGFIQFSWFFFFFSCFSPMLYSPTFNIKYLIPKGSVPGASVIAIFPCWAFHSCILFSEHNNASCCWMMSALRVLSSSKIQKKPFYSEIVNSSPCMFSAFTNSHSCQIVSRRFAQMPSLFESIRSKIT